MASNAGRTYSPEALAHLARYPAELLTTRAGRAAITKLDPLAFGLIYFPHHLSDVQGHVTLSEMHVDWAEQAKTWAVPSVTPRAWRRAFIAPRSSGKSSWWFLIIPMWAAAHQHRRFAIAFADSAAQATQHLATFKRELENNELLRQDFSELCKPSRRTNGVTEADSRDMYRAANEFTFIAKGVDSASLGAKQGHTRPDLLIFDDVEGAPGTYSIGQAESRLSTIVDGLFPLNEMAAVVMVGTTTLPGGIMHQLVQSATRNEQAAEWIRSEQVGANYYSPILANEDGNERSIWPAKWSLEFLRSIQHTRSFKLNFQNDPAGADGDYWSADDFRYGTSDTLVYTVISIDPAVTVKESSDYTGIAVVSYSSAAQSAVVRHAVQRKLNGAGLRAYVLQLLATYPETKEIRVESNQGGTMWHEILHDVPAKVVTFWSGKAKTVRASTALSYYQRGKVLHERPFPDAEQQMIAFPKALHDDVVDAIGSAVTYFLEPAQTRRPSVRVA